MTTVRIPRMPRLPRLTRRPRAAGVPFWLRPSTKPRPVTAKPTPRDPRWWIGAAVLTVSVLLLSFVAHVALFGALQESQTQAADYKALRATLANATAPTGPLDFNDHLVASGTPVALISIPKVGVDQVIVQGSSPDDLRSGPGHRRDTVMPGQVGTSWILGRETTYGAPFRSIANLAPGDKITVVSGQGKSTFKVLDLRRPGDRLPTAPTATESRVVLVSATGGVLAASSTVYVDAVRTHKGLPAVSPALTAAALDPGENVMQNDPNAMLPFLFALQWLAIASGLTLYLFRRWGRWQTWIIAVPVLLILGALTADAAISFLPNLV